MSDIMNSSVEVACQSNGGMDLLDFKNSSKRFGVEDVDWDMPHRFGAFICHLSSIILRWLLVTEFLQHLPEHLRDLVSITSE
jgi:hypothetical protein